MDGVFIYNTTFLPIDTNYKSRSQCSSLSKCIHVAIMHHVEGPVHPDADFFSTMVLLDIKRLQAKKLVLEIFDGLVGCKSEGGACERVRRGSISKY